MKRERHTKIIELVSSMDIEAQEELARNLIEAG